MRKYLPGLPDDKFLIEKFLEGVDVFSGRRVGTDGLFEGFSFGLPLECGEHGDEEF